MTNNIEKLRKELKKGKLTKKQINDRLLEAINTDFQVKNTILDLNTHLRNLLLEREFFLHIASLPDNIQRAELEAYYLILKAPNNKRFSSMTEIYNYLIKEHLSQTKLERPKYMTKRDKKYFLGRDGILTKLHNARLLVKQHTEKFKKSKKTWKHFIITTAGFQTVNNFVIVPNAGLRGQCDLSFTAEELLTGLEGYLYNNKPQFQIPKKELDKLQNIDIEDLRELTNRYMFGLGLGTIESLFSLFHPGIPEVGQIHLKNILKTYKGGKTNETAPKK